MSSPTSIINRFSSRRSNLREVFLADRLKEARGAKLKEKWNGDAINGEGLFVRERYRRLYQLLTNGNIEIRVVPKDHLFLHTHFGFYRCK